MSKKASLYLLLLLGLISCSSKDDKVLEEYPEAMWHFKYQHIEYDMESIELSVKRISFPQVEYINSTDEMQTISTELIIPKEGIPDQLVFESSPVFNYPVDSFELVSPEFYNKEYERYISSHKVTYQANEPIVIKSGRTELGNIKVPAQSTCLLDYSYLEFSYRLPYTLIIEEINTGISKKISGVLISSTVNDTHFEISEGKVEYF